MAPEPESFPERVVENAAFLDFARRIIRRAGERCGEADPWALASLVALRADLDNAITEGVAGLRAEGYSWADIARPLGITRQSCQQQYGPSITKKKASEQ